MPVSLLMEILDCNGQLRVLASWGGISSSEETLEPLTGIHYHVPEILKHLIACKNTPRHLADGSHHILPSSNRECHLHNSVLCNCFGQSWPKTIMVGILTVCKPQIGVVIISVKFPASCVYSTPVWSFSDCSI